MNFEDLKKNYFIKPQLSDNYFYPSKLFSPHYVANFHPIKFSQQYLVYKAITKISPSFSMHA